MLQVCSSVLQMRSGMLQVNLELHSHSSGYVSKCSSLNPEMDLGVVNFHDIVYGYRERGRMATIAKKVQTTATHAGRPT